MADVETARALLVMALQDLHDGEAALSERLSTVRDHGTHEELRACIAADQSRSAEQKRRLETMLHELRAEPGDAPNLWLRAILDDADNDASTISSGPLLDIALVGALRKGKQSERVSYETALALARTLALNEAASELASIRDEEQATDDELATILQQLIEKPLPEG